MDARPPRRLQSTGITGLDEVLNGGLGKGDLFLIVGAPGTGKTTLGNQLAYAEAKAGGVAIYATVLAETHERMLAHLRGFDFFYGLRMNTDGRLSCSAREGLRRFSPGFQPRATPMPR